MKQPATALWRASALDYATEGKYIFPCVPFDKLPATGDGGFRKATTDSEQIETWFANKYLNIGCWPGRSGLIVIDFDPLKMIADSHELARRLDAEVTTTSVETPTKGWHRYFRLPAGVTVGNSSGSLPPGVDVRSNNGYVLIPPSIVKYRGKDAVAKGVPDGFQGVYKFTNDWDPALIPSWLLEMIQSGENTETPTVGLSGLTRSDIEPELGQWQLSNKVQDLIFNPMPTTKTNNRSTDDGSITQALVLAGARDQDIFDIYSYFPCGQDPITRFAQEGRRILEVDISTARAKTRRPNPEQLPTLPGDDVGGANAMAEEAARRSSVDNTQAVTEDESDSKDAYSDIPAEYQLQWQEEWRAAAATGKGRFYGGQAFLDAFLRNDDQKGNDPIPAILPSGEVMMFVGPAGSGKTTTLVNMAVQKGIGRAILDAWECESGAVLYCATEDLYGVAERFASALAQVGTSASNARLSFHDKLPALVQPPTFGQKTAGGWDFFLSVRAEQYRGNLPDTLSVVILDYLRNATEGANENSNDDMGLALDAANRIARALKTGVILAAHTGKGDEGSARGAAVINDKAYCTAVLKGRADTAATLPVELYFTKAPKGAARPPTIHLQLTHSPNGGVYMMPVAPPDEGSQKAKVLRTFAEQGNTELTTKQLTDLIDEDVKMTVSRMVQRGELEKVGNSRPHRFRPSKKGTENGS